MYEAIYDRPVTAGEALPFALPGWIACAPFEEYLEMTIEEAGAGRAVLTMPFRVKHAQGKGLMHGGAVTSLGDTAVAMAIKSLLPVDTNFVTTELSLKFHAAVVGGGLKAVATAEQLDERSFKGVAELFDLQGVKVATFTALFKIPRSKA
ncbi:PaaI family thioesterase [Geobacter pelophilus]|uniref:PaaI family thioesterase n=1 Tax=Geoanaerobacter pelophilus TaxID=60036 RepID=A0AAW4L6E7_9BACT|nr:PaaI family thioesterase [Geoanaerobacter pelophilus]MBT0662831.1 PaaI family thioesterase [Geoanaerobacter pelophilus]